MTNDRRYHWLKENSANRIPRYHVFVDTEAYRERVRGGERQTFRCGVAHFYAGPKGRRAKESRARFTDAPALWRAVAEFCGPRHRTVVWCHNLGYDVRVAEALLELPNQGWTLVGHNMANRGTWLAWRRGDASLLMVDSASVFPTTLAQVGKTVGLGKPALPADQDSQEAWFTRCESDVDILRAAVLAYLKWLEREELGNFQWTGAGQSWAAFRHRFLTHKMLIHDDREALAAERRAMWAGRCEAYWHGTMLRQVLHEWDFSAAYARVARDVQVPTRLLGALPRPRDWQSYLDRRSTALLAVCTVTTETPVVPTVHNGRILWPVGTFNTTLWDVELRSLLAHGATVTVHKGWIYRTAPALKAWADWILAMLDAPDEVCPAVCKIVVKHWSRALIGRFAMTHRTWNSFGRAPTLDTRKWTCVDRRTNRLYQMLQVGREVWEETEPVEWDQSMPMVTGYVQAVCRVRLWEVVNALPREVALYVDTDSVFTTDRHHREVSRLARERPGLGLRLKRSWLGFTISGPRQIVTGDVVRVAGLPTHAVRSGRSTFDGQVWESLTKALKEGHPGAVHIRDRSWKLTGVDHRRVSRGVGWTEPVRLPAAI